MTFVQLKNKLKTYLKDDGNTSCRVSVISFYILILIFCLSSCSDSRADFLEEEKIFKEKFSHSSLKDLYMDRKGNLDSLKEVIRDLPEDSLKTNLIFDLSFFFYQQKDSAEFRDWNAYGFSSASAMGDSSRLAEAHWDLANFYADYEIVDSSFYHFNRASLVYSSMGDDLRTGKMLLNMGILQKNMKDYTGSEIITTKAIKLLNPVESTRDLYIGYNNLGILYNELEEYQEALKYHSKAEKAAQILADPLLMASTLNNKGVVYENMRDYQQAIVSFEESLAIDSIYFKNSRLYAMLIDNLAYSRFKGGNNAEVLNLFYSALAIRDSIGHQSGVVINKIHLGEFFLNDGDTVKGISYIDDARRLASQINNHRDWLASLLILSKFKRSESDALLNEYIKLNDSLQKNERTVRNKFARIRFETDEFIAQNQQLTEQNKLLIGGSAGGIVLSFLTVMFFRQKARNRRLKNDRDQQKANEDIYKLLLDQENKIEEGKSKEKERISRELHDGVLSKMFGIRFTLSHLNSKYDEASVETKQKHLDDLRQIEQEIRLISHDLQKDQFEEIGFLKILKHLVEDQTPVLGFSPSLKTDSRIPWERISNPVKMNLYRIVQEALQNIHKYAQAGEAEIDLKHEVKCLKVSISDNGKGFDVEKKVRGIGLKNMKSRVKEISGSFRILSSESGTVITIEIPISHG